MYTTPLLITIIVEVFLIGTIPWIVFFGSRFWRKFRVRSKLGDYEEKKISIIQNINLSFDNLVIDKKGAIIIIDMNSNVYEYIADHEYINAEVSANLITSIFQSTNSPLHDGALVISDWKIKSASAYISKLSEKKVPKVFGTRHRSALGLSEVTNAIIITLSEETRNIHIFKKGKFEKINKKDFFDKIYKYWE